MIKVNGNEINFGKFPNNETIMKKDSFYQILYTDEINDVVFKYTDDSDLIKLMFVKKYMDMSQVKSHLIILCMPYARMDRSEEASPFTLKYVTSFINDLNFEFTTVIEPHSDVTCALLNNAYAKYINFDLIEKVKEEVGFNEEEDYIMFPDAGASKRYNKMKASNVLIGHKDRDFKTGKINGLDLVGKYTGTGGKVIIVDDLSSYGGTFVHSAKKLRSEGFEEIYLLVAHAEDSIFKGNPTTKVNLFDHVDKIFTTDSLLTEHDSPYNARFKKKLKVYDIETLLGGRYI